MDRARARVNPLVLAVVGLLVLPALLPPVPAQGPELRDRGPIIIEGDDDLCGGDGHDDDGVVNCATADGSAARPYVIRGWRIEVPGGTCDTGDDTGGVPVDVDCPVVPACGGATALAAVSLCDLTLHVVVRDLAVRVLDGSGQAEGGDGTVRPLAGIHVRNAPHTTIASTDVASAGTAILVEAADGGADAGDGGAGPAPDATVRLAGVTLVTDLDDDPLEGNEAFSAPLLEVRGASVEVVDSTIDGRMRPEQGGTPEVDAGRRSKAVLVEGRGPEANGTRFVLRTSTVRDALHGLDLAGAAVEIVGNTFANHGAMGPNQGVEGTFVGSMGGSVWLANAAGVVEDNAFRQVQGVALKLLGGADVDAAGNTFETDLAEAQEVAVFNEDPRCRPHVRYNDINGLRLINRPATASGAPGNCVLDATRNWWGSPDGPGSQQVAGRADTTTHLPVPLADLPTVAVTAPPPGTVVRGKVTLRGTAAAGADDLTAVQATVAADADGFPRWDRPRTADGLETWTAVLDLGGQPVGPLPVWVRACADVDAGECSRPARLEVEVVDPVQTPVAVLEVAPRVVLPGQTVTLDGAASFTPGEAPLVAWRFDLGDGRRTEWLDASSTEATYDRPGAYTVSLEVRDAEGRTSSNFPEVTVRVVADDAAGDAGATVPHPAAVAVLGALAAAAWLVKARKAPRKPRGARRPRRSDRSHGRRRDRREERP